MLAQNTGGSLTNAMIAACAQQSLPTGNRSVSRDEAGAGSSGTSSLPADGSFWTGKLEASSALTVGTQTQETLSGRLVLAYQRNPSQNTWLKHTITAFEIEAAYGNAAKKGSPRIMTNQVSYGALVHSFIKSRTTIYPFGSLYHNFSQGMKLEQAYGLGVKYSFKPASAPNDEAVGKQLRHNSVVAVDLRGIHENFGTLASPFTSAAMGLSFDDSFHLGPLTKPTLIFQQHVEAVPALTTARAFQARAISAVVVPLTKRLNVTLQYNDFYIRNAPPNHRQNYSKTSVNFGYVLGKL